MPPTFPAAEPHGAIEEMLPDAFLVTGLVAFKPLVRLSRNMVILRTGDELALVNAVRLDEAGLQALDALGTVKHVLRIGFHGMDDAFYVDRHQATFWSVPGKEHAHGLTPDVELTEGTELPIADARLFLFRETVQPEAAILVERHGGLLVTCDSVQHWAPSPLMSLPAKVLTRLLGFQHPAQIGPPWSKGMTPEGGSLRPDFDRLADLPFKHLVGGHGGFLRDHGPERLRASIDRKYGAG